MSKELKLFKSKIKLPTMLLEIFSKEYLIP
jgi:hypothetical protein